MAEPEVPSDDWLVRGPADAHEVARRYDRWADHYDSDLQAWSYQAPAVVARTIVGWVATTTPSPRTVLDVGCGTGLVGRSLRSQGYAADLRGLDISEESLRIAERAGVYDDLTQADLHQPLPVPDDAADAVVCVGVMTYLPEVEQVWREFIRVVRPAGLVVVTQREDLWEPRGCQAVIDRLAADGAWLPLDVTGPAPYLPEATGNLGNLGCYYLTAQTV